MIIRPCRTPNQRTIRPVLAALALACLALACGEDDDENASQEAYREVVNGFTVVHLYGTPYEMGAQHARLLSEELKAGVTEIETNIELKLMFAMAKQLKLDKLAEQRSYPEIIEECKGMVSVMGKEGWTMDKCLVLNMGDAIAEFALNGLPTSTDITPGCAQLITSGKASADGRLYHARILDWARIEYIIKYPVLIVRHPVGEIPHVIIGFPGNLSPYQGMNAHGLVSASNEIHPLDNTVNDTTGESHVQLQGRILARAKSLDEATRMIKAANHMSLEVIVISDGKAQKGAVFEMAPKAVDVRGLSADGWVGATNHFVGKTTADLDKDPPKSDTTDRYKRLEQFTAKGGADSLLGKLNPTALIKVMRDRKNPSDGKVSPTTEFDDGKSLATNGALYNLVFDPEKRLFWMAAGKVPIPSQPFKGFSLDKLLGKEGAADHPKTLP